MTKKIFWVLLVASLLLFAYTQWGLPGLAGRNVQSAGELNADHLKLQDMAAKPQLAVAVVSAPASAPVAVAPAQQALPSNAPAVHPVPAVTPLPPAPAASPALTAPVKPAPPAAIAVTRTCMEWGEFSGTDLVNAEKYLAEMKLGERLTQRTVEYESGFWVYIPPLKNKAAVNKKLAELKAAGFTEYFVLKESKKLNNAISLGVFKTAEAARQVYKHAIKKGFKTVKMGERKRKLKFIVFGFKELDEEAMKHLQKLQKELPNSELKKVGCNIPS